MKLCETVWKRMELYGTVWNCTKLYETVRNCMELYGTVWNSLLALLAVKDSSHLVTPVGHRREVLSAEYMCK